MAQPPDFATEASDRQQTAGTLGRRATLQLDLQEVRRQINAAQAARDGAQSMATETSALADEHRNEGKYALAHSYSATSIAWRSRVIGLSSEIYGLKAEEQRLVAELERLDAPAVVLARDSIEGMDDTAGLCEVAACA